MAGTTLRDGRGWSASLFVSAPRGQQLVGGDPRLATSPAVNAMVSRRLSPSSRVSVELFNVFDRTPAAVDSLALSRSAPALDASPFDLTGSRGVRLNYRKTF